MPSGAEDGSEQGYIHFRDAAREFGVVDGVMQPTFMTRTGNARCKGHLTLASALSTSRGRLTGPTRGS